MNPRYQALAQISQQAAKQCDNSSSNPVRCSDLFGEHVFTYKVMQRMLPKKVYENILQAAHGEDTIHEEYADAIALAMKEWAISLGATHYSHWFQPLTGMSAEKHDAFIDWNSPDGVIEKFSGKQLVQGEPDASSFPSGGLRSTYEARGYTGWDPASPAFVWKAGNTTTLCIPSVFFSWTGDVLDTKIPLQRSDKQIQRAVMRLLRLTGLQASAVFSTVGLEQEYFVIDTTLRNLRPDLIQCGRTVIGASPSKGQELQDHYFGSVKERLLNYMDDFEEVAWKLAIPVRTRHNEVAPAQHEVAPVFEKSSLAVDHNIMLMELMRKVARNHGLSCLLHEKPFHGFNGSGKHCNWSLSTDSGINLFDPTDAPENNYHFLVLLTAVLAALEQFSPLFRASIGSANNDYRLGGHEAPPAILSIFLGHQLEQLIDNIVESRTHSSSQRDKYDLSYCKAPHLTKDNTDRNRTSPFAFTGNKFEFRAVGSSANPAFAITVINVTVAYMLNQILDEIEAELQVKTMPTIEEFAEATLKVIRPWLKKSRHICFSGDNYSQDWVDEAKRRRLPNFTCALDSFSSYLAPETIEVFQGVLRSHELKSRYEVAVENFVKVLNIETNLIIELFRTRVLPAAVKQQHQLAESIASVQKLSNIKLDLSEQTKILQRITEALEEAISLADRVEEEQFKAQKLDNSDAAHHFASVVKPLSEVLRSAIDRLETLVDDNLWTLPKYSELLFMV